MVYRVRKGGIKTHQIALAGIDAAASFAIFQLNVLVWGGIHMNLTGLVSILAGPLLGALIALVVNIFSAALGHGAVGLLGANTLVNASEAIIAYYVFKTLMEMDWVFPASASAATLGLSAGVFLMEAIIAFDYEHEAVIEDIHNVQHRFQDVITATNHIHEGEWCLEILFCRGPAARV